LESNTETNTNNNTIDMKNLELTASDKKMEEEMLKEYRMKKKL